VDYFRAVIRLPSARFGKSSATLGSLSRPRTATNARIRQPVPTQPAVAVLLEKRKFRPGIPEGERETCTVFSVADNFAHR
jgi:hypothetical protein